VRPCGKLGRVTAKPARLGVSMGRIGAHVSASGGPAEAARRARELGLECLQLFVGSPQTWAAPRLTDDEVARGAAAFADGDLRPVFVHAPYLINLASARPEVRAASRRTLVEQLRWADRIGASGVVVHVGSGGPDSTDAFDLVVEGLRHALDGHDGGAALILENDAGSGHRIGATFGELGGLIDALDGDARLRVCLDTAHALASGYELRTDEGLAAAVAEIEDSFGAGRLALLHTNDSKTDLGSHVDRHENLGRGKLGAAAFARILTHPALRDLPFVLEVPGYAGNGPDARNVAALRLLATGDIAGFDALDLESTALHPS
jgi:deoxyribonuclease IV